MRLSRFAFVIAACTFVLVLMGGVVHSTGSSLACPDWPLCFGEVMPKMEGKVAVEHSHRMVATGVGILTIGLLVLAIRRRREYPGILPWAAAALGLVIAQGVIGGVTGLLHLPPEGSTAHLAMSQAFLGIILLIAWRAREIEGGRPLAAVLPSGPRKLLLAAAGLVYVQLVVAAAMRHTGAGLACMHWPLCKGALFPPGEHWLVQLHMTHRLLGVLAFFATLAAGIAAKRGGLPKPWARAAIGVHVVVLVQIGVGFLALAKYLDLHVVTLHLGLAALIWGTLVSLVVVTSPRRRAASAPSGAPTAAAAVSA